MAPLRADTPGVKGFTDHILWHHAYLLWLLVLTRVSVIICRCPGCSDLEWVGQLWWL